MLAESTDVSVEEISPNAVTAPTLFGSLPPLFPFRAQDKEGPEAMYFIAGNSLAVDDSQELISMSSAIERGRWNMGGVHQFYSENELRIYKAAD